MSEVYFNAPNMKVFDVVLNGDLTVSSDLDIFEKVGLFSLENNSISFFLGWSWCCPWRVHWVLYRRKHNPLSGFPFIPNTNTQQIHKYEYKCTTNTRIQKHNSNRISNCWSLQGEESEISAGKIRVEFIKSYRDNPKINAIVLIKVREQIKGKKTSPRSLLINSESRVFNRPLLRGPLRTSPS